MATVTNRQPHPQDLDDGRVLAPGESASKVDEKAAHNAALIEAGALEIEKRGGQSAGDKED